MSTYINYQISKQPQLENNCDYLVAKELFLRNIGSEISKEKKTLTEQSLKGILVDNSLIENLTKKETEIWEERLRLAKIQKTLNCATNRGNTKITECIGLDFEIKRVKDEIALLRKKITLKPSEKRILDGLTSQLLILEKNFSNNNCRDEIEKLNLEQSAIILTENSATQEKNVLPSSYKEQYVYIALGSVVLLVGLYIISKK